ncbi:MAG: RdgB/HAM1 family non-canonical purine NTP pyrophosphatase [Acidobacteriota bacterium]|jgi:XTP/dITP diphosphohydrolase|nr:RdgB/HAM1 family non-canonical purine NTP pyrophosphatase [Acidobacteriota bacterium]
MTELLLATRNAGKKREIADSLCSGAVLLSLLSLDEVDAGGEVEESGKTFAENSRLKADFYSRLSGLTTLGDDSGLEVLALGGRPGVRSARYAGAGASDEMRIEKLLAEMKDITDRRARFVSAVCISRNGSPLASFIGTVEGEILRQKRGNGGFGYDPLFLYPPLGKTFAELSLAEKNKISHRARALAQAREFILNAGLG